MIVAIRNFFFQDIRLLCTFIRVNPAFESATFLIRFLKWKFLNMRWITKDICLPGQWRNKISIVIANHQPRIVNTVKNTVINTKMATSFPGSLSYSSDKIENHNTRHSKIQISRALRGMLKKYFKNLCIFNQILFHFIMYFYQHFYFLSVLSIIDSFYKFQLQNDSKTLLIIYMLKGAIVNLQIIIIIAVLPKRFLEESWVLEFNGYL